MPTVEDIRWFKQAFRAQIEAALVHDPFDLDMVVAIACQETGNVWSVLRKKGLSLDRILALCVGDTIDKGRTAFPKTKGELVAWPQGEEMFAIARHALEDMATYIPGYGGAVGDPDKFCHGFGVFQRDLQHFKVDPEYFLEKRYEIFEDALAQCLVVLRHGVAHLGFESKTKLTDEEFAMVAIVYNTGKFIKGKALKQGYKSSGKYYGEWIYYFIGLSRKVDAAPLRTGAHFVIARNGLKLRGGPGTTSRPS